MSPALFLFELLKMCKLSKGPLVLYHLPKYSSREKTEAKNVEKMKKKKKKKNNFKIPRALISSAHKQNACKVSEAFA